MLFCFFWYSFWILSQAIFKQVGILELLWGLEFLINTCSIVGNWKSIDVYRICFFSRVDFFSKLEPVICRIWEFLFGILSFDMSQGTLKRVHRETQTKQRDVHPSLELMDTISKQKNLERLVLFVFEMASIQSSALTFGYVIFVVMSLISIITTVWFNFPMMCYYLKCIQCELRFIDLESMAGFFFFFCYGPCL